VLGTQDCYWGCTYNKCHGNKILVIWLVSQEQTNICQRLFWIDSSIKGQWIQQDLHFIGWHLCYAESKFFPILVGQKYDLAGQTGELMILILDQDSPPNWTPKNIEPNLWVALSQRYSERWYHKTSVARVTGQYIENDYPCLQTESANQMAHMIYGSLSFGGGDPRPLSPCSKWFAWSLGSGQRWRFGQSLNLLTNGSTQVNLPFGRGHPKLSSATITWSGHIGACVRISWFSAKSDSPHYPGLEHRSNTPIGSGTHSHISAHVCVSIIDHIRGYSENYLVLVARYGILLKKRV